MDILSEKSRQVALRLIWYAERHHHLRIKGGLLGLGLVTGSKAHKIMSDKARDEFQRIWNGIRWDKRESILQIAPFLCRAYVLVPRSSDSLHAELDLFLYRDGLRIRDGELRRLKLSGSSSD